MYISKLYLFRLVINLLMNSMGLQKSNKNNFNCILKEIICTFYENIVSQKDVSSKALHRPERRTAAHPRTAGGWRYIQRI